MASVLSGRKDSGWAKLCFSNEFAARYNAMMGVGMTGANPTSIMVINKSFESLVFLKGAFLFYSINHFSVDRYSVNIRLVNFNSKNELIMSLGG